MNYKTLLERMNALEAELLFTTEKSRGQNPEGWARFDRYYDGFRVAFRDEYARGIANPREEAPSLMVDRLGDFYDWYQKAYETRTGLPAEPWVDGALPEGNG